jgi:hypothetical protein
MPQVIMYSDEFGFEEFDYDTEEEARQGYERLKKSCELEASRDSIQRRLILALETWETE